MASSSAAVLKCAPIDWPFTSTTSSSARRKPKKYRNHLFRGHRITVKRNTWLSFACFSLLLSLFVCPFRRQSTCTSFFHWRQQVGTYSKLDRYRHQPGVHRSVVNTNRSRLLFQSRFLSSDQRLTGIHGLFFFSARFLISWDATRRHVLLSCFRLGDKEGGQKTKNNNNNGIKHFQWRACFL